MQGIEPRTGKPLWDVTAPGAVRMVFPRERDWILGLEDGSVVAVDSERHQTLWRWPGELRGTLVLPPAGDVVPVWGQKSSRLYGPEAATGKVLWQRQLPSPGPGGGPRPFGWPPSPSQT